MLKNATMNTKKLERFYSLPENNPDTLTSVSANIDQIRSIRYQCIKNTWVQWYGLLLEK